MELVSTKSKRPGIFHTAMRWCYHGMPGAKKSDNTTAHLLGDMQNVCLRERWSRRWFLKRNNIHQPFHTKTADVSRCPFEDKLNWGSGRLPQKKTEIMGSDSFSSRLETCEVTENSSTGKRSGALEHHQEIDALDA